QSNVPGGSGGPREKVMITPATLSSPGDRVLASAILSVLLAAPAGASEVYFEQTTTVQSAGAPSGPGVLSRVWYAGRRMRLEAADERDAPALVLRLDRGTAYRIDPERKRAVELDLGRLPARAPLDLPPARSPI